MPKVGGKWLERCRERSIGKALQIGWVQVRGHRVERAAVGHRAWCRMEGVGIGPRRLLWVGRERIWD